jgi:hypothetical protein
MGKLEIDGQVGNFRIDGLAKIRWISGKSKGKSEHEEIFSFHRLCWGDLFSEFPVNKLSI